MRVLALASDEPSPRLAQTPVEPLPEQERRLHAPDVHFLSIEESALTGRCSCWWTQAPVLPGERVGLIGHFASSDRDSSGSLLAAARDRLRAAGCTLVVGPMDGNTWRRYRFITERGGEPSFFLEPDNADAWPADWRAAGFSTFATYTSALTEDLGREDPRLARARSRLADAGVAIRSLDMNSAEADLRRMFALSLGSFSRNFLYSTIDESEFLEQNRAVLPYVHPDLVLLAERNGELAGFVFAIPDLLQKRRGNAIDTIVIKTVAVAPGVGLAGLGSVLVGSAHAAARRLGFTRAIHALMHAQNVSQNISRRYARPIREYQLFAQRLPA